MSLTSPRPSSRSPRCARIAGSDGSCVLTTAQETAQLEAQAFELEQKTAIAHEAKTVLESWVRYEGQVKQRQQRELAESIIAKIEKELENPKTLKQILDQSVADVESASSVPSSLRTPVLTKNRDRLPEGCISVLQHIVVKFVQCYIHLCNSQAHPIESSRGLGKGQTISLCSRSEAAMFN